MPPHTRLLLHTLLIATATAGCSPDPDDSDGADASADISADAGSVDGGPVLIPGKLGLISATPARGPLEGGGDVDLLGQEFDDGTKVFFGDNEAEVTWRSGTTHLYVTVPEATIPGRVDIKVRNAFGDVSVLPSVYTYLGNVRVDDIAPALGPHTGGTVVEIRGAGFLPGDRVLVGYRECLQSQVVDSNTIVAITPAAQMAAHQVKQSLVVSVRHASGVANLKKVFTYGRAPEIHRVAPSVVPVAGTFVTLHGHALGNGKKLYAGGMLANLAAGTASSSRGAALPALAALVGSAGSAVSLLIDGSFGHSVLDPAYAYEQGKLALHGVTPAAGSAAGGTEVGLIAELAGAKVNKVSFGGATAPHKLVDGEVVVTTPARDAGAVDVVLHTDKGAVTAKGAYTYFAPPKITSITPQVGPIAGGTDVQVSGTGFVSGCVLRIGGNKAIITDIADTGILARTPAGPPGAADVTVTCGPVQAVLPAGFGYTTGGPRINAVSPSGGATGGETLVIIHGSGFTAAPKVYFGGLQAHSVEVLDSGRLRLKTPPPCSATRATRCWTATAISRPRSPAAAPTASPQAARST